MEEQESGSIAVGCRGCKAEKPHCLAPPDSPSFTQLLPAPCVCVNRGGTRYSNPASFQKCLRIAANRAPAAAEVVRDGGPSLAGRRTKWAGPSVSEAEVVRRTMCTKFEEDMKEKL